MKNIYKDFGIDDKVCEFSESILKDLKERFDEIDRLADINQLKVIASMQKNNVSEASRQPDLRRAGDRHAV